MSKFRVDSPANTPLDPFAFEDRFVKPTPNNTPFSGVADQLEFVAPDKVDPGYGTMGNSGYAVQAINEAKAYDQGALELTAKGLANVVKTIGIEIAKTPGYVGGMVGAIGNEVVGDGKDSMSLIVDNAWVNAFERLDESAKEMMPIYISKQVQEGNLMDKLGSGAWWATTGADGLGFMLSMFAPGAALKAIGVGAKLARVGEGIANIAPKLGKWGTGLGLLEDLGEAGFAYTSKFAKNAGGYASAAINTAIESSAEAANTFDNVRTNFINQGLSEEEANSKAGEAAAAVFKGNMALLAVSNVLDEMWIWKTIGSAGEKQAAQSMLSKIFKDGNIDMDAVKNLPKEFTRAKVLGRMAANFGKGIIKEGVYEEGSQTTLQQNIEKGKTKDSVLGNLSDVVSSYFDDFANNVELHEAMFLGGLLGGGASLIGTVQENRALKSALTGSQGRTKDNSIFAKYGILPETKNQKGLMSILKEDHIKQFRSYKDFLEDDGSGVPQLNEQKLMDAQLEQADNLRANILYDISTAQGNKLGQEIFGQFLAANYVQGFLGQEGGLELFQEHTKSQVLPAWQKRFLESFGREATAQESQNYLQNFTKSGERVFKAHNTAENTNYPERYYQEATKEYQDFKQKYFHDKFQTLVTLDSVKSRKALLLSEMSEAGIFEGDLEKLSDIKDPVKRIKAQEIKDELKEADELETEFAEQYTKFFTKQGVKEMFELFKKRKETFQKLEEEVKEENIKLKQQVDELPTKNQIELDRLNKIAEEEGGGNLLFKDKFGEVKSLEELQNIPGDLADAGFVLNDVSKAEYDAFKESGKASPAVLKRIAKKLVNKEPLSDREKEIAAAEKDALKTYFEEEVSKVKEKLNNIESKSVEDTEPNAVSQAIDDVYKKKGVNLYPSTGRNLEDTLVEIEPGRFAEKMTGKVSQKLWFETLDSEVKDNPSAYTVQVVRLDDKSNEELHLQILRDSDPDTRQDSDIYTVLYKDGKPIIKEGNYVFTGLWRPSTLYPVKNGKPTKFVLAESAILNNFLIHVKLPDLDLKNISNTQKDYLKTFGITEFTEEGILTAAFFHAKSEYTKWYQNLQDNPSQLQIAGTTRGHTIKTYNEDKTIRWNSLTGNIPGLMMKDTTLVGGRFALSVIGTIEAGGEQVDVPIGDLVVIDQDNNIHPTRARNLNMDEVGTVLYLLSLRARQSGPTEAIKLKPPKAARYSNISLKEIPVFYNEKNPRANLIESMISFGSKDGRKGEIYFNRDSIAKNPILVWTDFEGVTQNIEVSIIRDAVDSRDFTKIQSLIDFLQQKRVNVNEHLLGKSNKSEIFTQLNVDAKGELVWDQSKTYFDFLLSDVLTTTTSKLPGYPNRAQRNVWFNKQPIAAPENLDEFVNIFTITDEGKAVPVEMSTGLVELGKGMATGAGKSIIKADVESKGSFTIDISKTGVAQGRDILNDMLTLAGEMNYIFTQSGKGNDILVLTKRQTPTRRRATKSLDEFKEMDKILTTTDLLKAKIQSGEIIQNCK